MNANANMDRLTDLYDFFLNAPIGLHILDQGYKIRMANQADLDITGYSSDPSAYVGRSIMDLHADSSLASQMLDHLASGRPLVNFHARLRRRDGSQQPVVIHSNSRFKEGRLVNTRYFAFPEPDTLPSRGSATAPRAAADFLNTMTKEVRGELFDVLDDFFENAPVALHIVGPDGLIRRANRMELESLGYQDEPEKYIGHHISEFHADQSVIDEMLERLIGGRPLIHYRAKLVHRNGKIVPVVIYSSPRFNDNGFVNTRCFTFPRAVDGTVEMPSFSWPRNDTDAAPANADSLTVALKRMAGRKAAEESLGFLAQMSKEFASRDYANGLAAICRLIVPFLADWCSIEFEKGDAVHMLGTARANSITGSDDLLRAVVGKQCRNDGGHHVLRVPFTTGDDESGALLLARDCGRDAFGPADIALAEEVARRIAVAIELERLRESSRLRMSGRAANNFEAN